ncbi:hypothetical protein [Sagittula sp. SSi028]|uniref:hypothetical protein n=1 Tax=Sagittula sp. SSi028 TaxID=3400636 RepID=UPI003AF71B3A
MMSVYAILPLRVVLLSALLLLAGCGPLDREETLREELASYFYISKTLRFESQGQCTAAIFQLVSQGTRRPVAVVSDVRAGLRLIKQGRVVAFDVTDATPNEVSEQVMSISLEEGVGLISSFIGPAMECMDDQFQIDAYYALTTPDTLAIYDPAANAFMMLHRPNRLLFFMRGTI